MNKTKYLKELEKNGELPDLLEKLHLPSREYSKKFRDFKRICSIYFTDEALIIETSAHDYSSNLDFEQSHSELNDFMFIDGIYDPKQERLQTLFDFMTNRFPETYKKDCIAYLNEMRDEESAKIEEEKKKLDEKYSTIVSIINKE